MGRIGRFIAIASAVLLLACGCTKRDNRLKKEILLSTVWIEHAGGAASGSYLYDFDPGGIVSVYMVSGNEAVLESGHRYLLDIEMSRITIEGYGVMDIREITADRMVMENEDSGSDGLTLLRYTGEVKLP